VVGLTGARCLKGMPANAGEGKSGMRIRGSVARRAMLGAGLVALTALAWWSVTAHRANALGEARTLTMYNIHTKETLTVTFKRDGQYDQGALKQLNTFMRDWRANKETAMDPALIDLIWTLHKQLGSHEPVHLICGHRTAATNASMRKKGGGQAKRSQHILGKAADISFPDVSAKMLRNSALVQEHGGVGYYPTSGIPFVHVDTGNVRMWPRIARLELAALFPDGRTKYLPTDGKPITLTDYKLAMAKGLVSKTMVASAAPLPRPAREPEPTIEAELETAQPILASYTPEPEAHRQGEPPPPAKLFAYASAGGMSLPRPSLRPKAPKEEANFPLYRDATVVSAPEVDDDHPDELSYVPFEIAGLMTDASVTYSRSIAPMTHPEQGSIDYLFEDMDQPTAFTLRKSSGYSSLADAQRFSGHAVRNLYAEMATSAPSPTRLAQSTR
jgi:uncharacterized protein YcbK (DUF882 family)